MMQKQKILHLIPFYAFYIEWKTRRANFLHLKQEALQQFATTQPIHGSIEDYIHALKKFHVNYSEYMYQYEFWKLNEQERQAFLSRDDMQAVYRHIVTKEVRQHFYNKGVFLKSYSKYIHRKWLILKESTYDDFVTMINHYDCIVKPIEGSLGKNIYIIPKGSLENPQQVFFSLQQENAIIEECISEHSLLSAFHPASLNTIRITMMSNGVSTKVIGAFLRMGNNGACIDNAHAGGIFASIDCKTGQINSDGTTTESNNIITHPYSKLPIKGTQIPCWNAILQCCDEATLANPKTRIVGWDVCVRGDETIEIIEGNHGPDIDVLQSPLKIGIRQQINDAMTQLWHCDLRNYSIKRHRQLYF